MPSDREFIESLSAYERTVLHRMARESSLRVSHGSLPVKSHRWISYEEFYDQIKDTANYKLRVAGLRFRVNVWQPLVIKLLPVVKLVNDGVREWKKMFGYGEEKTE